MAELASIIIELGETCQGRSPPSNIRLTHVIAFIIVMEHRSELLYTYNTNPNEP
jgi:hypothetical protein